jgi:hypothetical protein
MAEIAVLVDAETARRKEIQLQVKAGHTPCAATATTDAVAQPRTSALCGGDDKDKKKKPARKTVANTLTEGQGHAGSTEELRACGYKGCAYELDPEFCAYGGSQKSQLAGVRRALFYTSKRFFN